MKNQIKHKIPKYQQTVLQCFNTTLIIQIVMAIRRGLNLLHMLEMSSEEHTQANSDFLLPLLEELVTLYTFNLYPFSSRAISFIVTSHPCFPRQSTIIRPVDAISFKPLKTKLYILSSLKMSL